MDSSGIAWEYASTGRRFGAQMIDNVVATLVVGGGYGIVIAGILSSADGLVLAGLVVALVTPFAYALLLAWWQGATGLTPGKKLLRLQTVDEETGRPIGIGRAFARQLLLGLFGPVNVVQLFTIGSHPRRQGWHDRAVHSVVVDGRRPADQRVAAAMPTAPPPPSLATGAPHSPLAPPQAVPAVATPQPNPVATPVATQLAPAALVPQAPPPPGMVGPPPGVASRTVVEPPEVPLPVTPIAVSAAAPASAPRRTWHLLSGDGSRQPVITQTLVGRDPAATLVPGAVTWPVVDPALSVSKSHALFGVGPDGLWVEDWHSTNGVRMRRDGLITALDPHSRTTLFPRDEVLLGDFVLTVEVNA